MNTITRLIMFQCAVSERVPSPAYGVCRQRREVSVSRYDNYKGEKQRAKSIIV